MQGLLQQFILWDNRTQSPALFQNIFKFCKFLPIFSNIVPFFCPFSEKSRTCLYFLEQAPSCTTDFNFLQFGFQQKHSTIHILIKSETHADSIRQGLIQAVFDISIPILGILFFWGGDSPNLILSNTETTNKYNSNFLINPATCEHDNKKIINKCNAQLVWTP